MTAIEKDLKDKEKEMKLKEQEALEFYHFLKDRGCILLEVVVGSQAHGTSTPESDVDKAFIYILPKEFIYGTKYKEQLRIHKDYTGFEIKRFLELAYTNNPTVLELLYSPEDCIIYKHPVFNHATDIRDQILTKRCRHSFAGYARKQIQKAKGLDKMQNWEKDRVTKKEPIDFCHVIDETGYGSRPLAYFLDDNDRDQKFCGITKIPNARDVFALFYDMKAHECFSERVTKEDREEFKAFYKGAGGTVGLGYKGVAKSGVGESVAESNQLRLSSIPKGESPIAILIYNKDSYIKSCKDYKSYQTWLENRNEQRYVDNKEHGQSYDGKNLMHCKRLLQIAREIAETGTVQIRRPNPEELQDIRKGRVELDSLIEWAESEMNELGPLYDASNLPVEVDAEVINQTLIKIRTDFYDGNFEETEAPKVNKFVERYKDFSEFKTMLRNWFLKMLPNPYYDGEFDQECEFISHDETEVIEKCCHDGGRVRTVDVMPWKRNPQYTDKEDGKKYDIMFENLVIFGLTDDKLTMGGGGDWENSSAIFDLVEHEEGFTTINERDDEEEWEKSGRFELGDLFKWLEIPVEYREEEV